MSGGGVTRFGRALIIAGGLVSVAAVVVAVALTGSPGAARASKLDAARVHDLVRIEEAVALQRERDGALPASLDAVRGGDLRRHDPVSGLPYGYRVLDARRIELCATFATDTADTVRQAEPWLRRDWPHTAGPVCFVRALSPTDG